MSDEARHVGDGLDQRGRGLEIVIRIAPDGKVYLHDLTPDLLPVIEALNPRDEVVRARVEACRGMESEVHA
jgi:hypothetical protein